MDQIAEQLQAEITSLEQHIQQTSSRFLAAQWAGELIEPFEQLEEDLDDEALREAVQAMYVARARFKVNGHLAQRIDSILDRHLGLIDHFEDEVDPVTYEDVADETPDPDPGGTDSLFEDEEAAEPDTVRGLLDDENEPSPSSIEFSGDDSLPDTAQSVTFSGEEEIAPAPSVTFSGDEGDEATSPPVTFTGDEDNVDSSDSAVFTGAMGDGESAPLADFTSDKDDQDSKEIVRFYTDEGVDDSAPSTGAIDFGDDEEATEPTALPGVTPPAPDVPQDSAGPVAATDELFANGKASKPAGDLPRRQVEDKRREAAQREKTEAQDELFAIFSDKISLDDLQAALDITVPPEDLRNMENMLRARMADRVLVALRSSKVAAGQYMLLPRITRFVENGNVVPCTLKNLARRFHQRFGDIRDLMRYRNEAMMTSEIPEPGWALITPEAARESLGKNYMEQNQYLRHLAASLNTPSHLLRRRTVVEGIYDLIVGQMVLGKELQRLTLDWTASSPAKNDFVCVYNAPEGIRVRDLSRTTHHPSLGVSPNW